MSQQNIILCKLKVQDPLTDEIHSLMGEVNIEQILTRENNWITLKNTRKVNGSWQKIEMTLFKGDILDIIIYEPHSFFTFDKNTFMLNNSLFAPKFKT